MTFQKTLSIGVLTLFSSFAQASTIETIPDWDGSQNFGTFGKPNTATFGQTFSVNGSNTNLVDFSLYIDDDLNPSPIQFRFFVMDWDLDSVSGSVLFESSTYTTTNNNGLNGFEEFVFDTDNLNLTSGNDYVAFVSASKDFGSIISNATGTLGATNNAYNNGHMVYINSGSDFDYLSSNTWNQNASLDLAFSANFASPVSEPASLLMLLGGLGFISLIASRKNA